MPKKETLEVVLAESSLATSNVSTLPTALKHRPTKHWSLRKTENSLPKRPGKRNEIIGVFANRFNLRITFKISNRGRKNTV